MKLIIGPAAVFLAACLVHDVTLSVILGIIAVGWWTSNERGQS